MTTPRKPAQARERDLRLAIHRIERGRSHTKATSLNISTVAREAGVSPSLIHNQYPAIAEEIRTKTGASSRQQRDKKHEELKDAQARSRGLASELADARHRIQQLASINETLLLELRTLKAKAVGAKVVDLRPRTPEKD